jgi:hypothetical protein
MTATLLIGIAAGIAGLPIAANALETAPVVRKIRVYVVPSKTYVIPNVHVGIYLLNEYTYGIAGKLTKTRKNDLLVEHDLVTSDSYGMYDHALAAGEYEIHIQPVNSRTIIKRFIVDNLSLAPITLNFNVAPIEDPVERAKIEVIRIGPSLAELEMRIAGLAKQNEDLAIQVAELKKKVSR